MGDSRKNNDDKSEMLKIPEQIIIMAAARTLHTVSASKRWTLLASVTLTVFSSAADSQGTIKMLSMNFEEGKLFISAAFILYFGIIWFCVAHSMVLRVGMMYHELLYKFKGESKITSNFSLSDISHSLYLGDFIRIYPTINNLPIAQKVVYRLLRFFIDIVFLGLPYFGLLYSIRNTHLPEMVKLVLFALSLVPASFLFSLFWKSRTWSKNDYC